MNIINPYRFSSDGLPTSNITNAWDFTSDVLDDVGSNDGTATGTITYGTIVGDIDCIDFDGSTNYISFSPFYPADPYTVSFLFESDLSSGHRSLFAQDRSDMNGGFFTVRVNRDGSNRCGIQWKDGSTNEIRNFDCTTTDLNHVVVSYSVDNFIKMWVNGTLEVDETITSSNSLGSDETRAGSNRTGGLKFDGKLGGLKVWDIAFDNDLASLLSTTEKAGTKIY